MSIPEGSARCVPIVSGTESLSSCMRSRDLVWILRVGTGRGVLRRNMAGLRWFVSLFRGIGWLGLKEVEHVGFTSASLNM